MDGRRPSRPSGPRIAVRDRLGKSSVVYDRHSHSDGPGDRVRVWVRVKGRPWRPPDAPAAWTVPTANLRRGEGVKLEPGAGLANLNVNPLGNEL